MQIHHSALYFSSKCASCQFLTSGPIRGNIAWKTTSGMSNCRYCSGRSLYSNTVVVTFCLEHRVITWHCFLLRTMNILNVRQHNLQISPGPSFKYLVTWGKHNKTHSLYMQEGGVSSALVSSADLGFTRGTLCSWETRGKVPASLLNFAFLNTNLNYE